MGLPEIQAIKKVPGAYKAGEATPKVLASLQAKKPKPIAKQSAKAKARQKDEKTLHTLDKALYAEIWAASPHRCFECGCKLPKEPQTIFFHHLLPKAIYPAFRHTPENICILCPKDHAQAEIDLSKTPKVKQRTAEVLKQLIR